MYSVFDTVTVLVVYSAFDTAAVLAVYSAFDTVTVFAVNLQVATESTTFYVYTGTALAVLALKQFVAVALLYVYSVFDTVALPSVYSVFDTGTVLAVSASGLPVLQQLPKHR